MYVYLSTHHGYHTLNGVGLDAGFGSFDHGTLTGEGSQVNDHDLARGLCYYPLLEQPIPVLNEWRWGLLGAQRGKHILTQENFHNYIHKKIHVHVCDVLLDVIIIKGQAHF